MKKHLFYITVFCALNIICSCTTSINAKQLYGKWKYIKVENPNAHPPDSVRKAELEEQSPYINFNRNNSLQIIWAGKMLSQGKFNLNGKSIMYHESLVGGKIKNFSFFISLLDEKHLIFETLGEDGTRVTAIK